MEKQIVIIGSGPAGTAAAIYAARAELEPLVFEGPQPGGQLTTTIAVENYPGFPEGVGGNQLIELMKKQAKKFGADFVADTVHKVDLHTKPFKIYTPNRTISAQAIIIATGASARWLGLEEEEKLKGKGVSACATCDGFFFKNQEVIVVGGGDTAMEEALFLTRFAKRVKVVHRRDKLRASKILQKQAQNNAKITFIWNSIVTKIEDVDKGRVTGVVLRNTKDGQMRFEPCDGVFIAIGHHPNTSIFAGQIEMDEKGYIVTKHLSTRTSIEGVFAAGDVADPIYKQAITAAGSGCMAALEAEHYISTL